LKNYELSRVRTGFEKVLAQRVNPPFAYSALDDGEILDINNSSKLIKLKYKNGDQICLSYGQEYSNNSGQGFYATQNIRLNNIIPGSKFKKGDILIYNEDFFSPDPYSSQVNWKIGVLANFCIMECDNTLEDSSALSRSLGDKLGFEPVHIRTINLNKSTTVHHIADIGTELSAMDKLITFDESDMDDSFGQEMDSTMLELLQKINRATPKAKYSGEVVKIELFYKCDPAGMSDSVFKLVKKYNGLQNKKSKYAKDSENWDDFLPIDQIKSTNRIGSDLLEDDNVLVKFYIKDDLSMERGDKLVLDSSLKSVIAKIFPEDIVTESGTVVQGLFSPMSINNRIILSPMLRGFTNRILEDLEEEVISIFNE